MVMPNILTAPVASLDLSLWSEPWAAIGDWYNTPIREILPSGGSAIVAQVVVSEEHSDDLIITDHPVEGTLTNGTSVITDHAVKRPAEVQLQMGWSNAWVARSTAVGDVKAIYEQILELQASRIPFTVFTGKRVYYNMLVASLRTHTDASLEYSFMADIGFREVILVNTQVIVAGSSYNQGSLASPEVNAATLPGGTVQVQPTVISDNLATGLRNPNASVDLTVPAV